MGEEERVACICAAVIDASIVRLIHVSPAAVDAAKSIKESTDFKCKTDAGHKICNQIVCLCVSEIQSTKKGAVGCT